MIDTHPFADFEEAAREVLAQLRRRFGYQLFMVTRTEDDDWIVLQSEDHGYGVAEGTVLRWSDSFCKRMVDDEGPRAAPRAAEIQAYAEAPIGRAVEIGAYIGLPLTRADGSLFGTLCGIDPLEQKDMSNADRSLLELMARMLSTILQHELTAQEQARSLQRVKQEATTEPLTGLLNRRGWDQALEAEEHRARRVGSPVCVFVIDVDGLKQVNDSRGHDAGDRLLESAARCLESVLRDTDVAARVGGDEFSVLVAECKPELAGRLHERMRAAFDEAAIAASIGHAMREPASGLEQAWKDADQDMYRDKLARRERAADSAGPSAQ
jgi:diguanylate cyclase (GGDEF)-like protein